MITLGVTVTVSVILLIAYLIFEQIEKRKNISKVKSYERFLKCLELNVNRIEKLPLAGVTEDGNSDFTFSEAIKKISLSNEVRVKINE